MRAQVAEEPAPGHPRQARQAAFRCPAPASSGRRSVRLVPGAPPGGASEGRVAAAERQGTRLLVRRRLSGGASSPGSQKGSPPRKNPPTRARCVSPASLKAETAYSQRSMRAGHALDLGHLDGARDTGVLRPVAARVLGHLGDELPAAVRDRAVLFEPAPARVDAEAVLVVGAVAPDDVAVERVGLVERRPGAVVRARRAGSAPAAARADRGTGRGRCRLGRRPARRRRPAGAGRRSRRRRARRRR